MADSPVHDDMDDSSAPIAILPQLLTISQCQAAWKKGLALCGGSRGEGKVHVWVGGVGSPRGEDGVMMRLSDAGAAAPLSILRVGGCRPGLILQFASAVLVLPLLCSS